MSDQMTKRHNELINEILTPFLKNVKRTDGKHLRDGGSTWNAGIVDRTVNSLVTVMKKQCLTFKKMFREVIKTGSYYSQLKVTEPTEFDLDLVLRLPLETTEVEFTPDKEHPTFVSVKILAFVPDLKLATETKSKKTDNVPKSFVQKGGFVSKANVQQWMQYVIGKALESKDFKDLQPSEVKTTKLNLEGPAWTLKITTNYDEISVDLVPVIDGTNLPFPKKIIRTTRYKNLSKKDRMFVLVPKSCFGPSTQLSQTSDLWRIAFPRAEKKLLDDKGCVRTVIKLFKILRDLRHWDEIYSFLITAIFIEAVATYPRANQWKEKNLGSIFMKMLKVFHEHFTKAEPFLPHYFIRKANLLKDVNPIVANKVAEDIARIINMLEANPQDIKNVFEEYVESPLVAAAAKKK